MDGNMIEKNRNINKPWLDNYDNHVPENIKYPHSTINTILFDAKEKYPSRIFISYKSREFTYQLIFQNINTLANNLRQLGFHKGERVAILLPNIPQFIIAYYATLAVGCIVVAMNPKYTQTELELLFRRSGAAHVFCLDSHMKIINSIKQKIKINSIIVTKLSDYQNITKKATELGNEFSSDGERVCYWRNS